MWHASEARPVRSRCLRLSIAASARGRYWRARLSLAALCYQLPRPRDKHVRCTGLESAPGGAEHSPRMGMASVGEHGARAFPLQRDDAATLRRCDPSRSLPLQLRPLQL